MRIRAVTVISVPLIVFLGFAVPSASKAETREIVAGPEYERSSFHNWWWGQNYRDVWLTPANIEILDLQREAGGLKPLFSVGGTQTLGLAFQGADGRSYTFRSVDKNLRAFLPPEWSDSIFATEVQDQVSATHPAVSPVVSGLSESLPWMNEPPARLVIMPDDPALGEFREDLAGRLGTFGEFPSEANDAHDGYLGATEILSSRDLWLKWIEAPINIDVDLFLKYRIFDLWIGNWDRHSKQWRWAYSPETESWRPIAEDMDQVMADYRGTMLKMARWYFPKVLKFGDEISHIEGAGANGADIDRWLLVGHGYEAFMETARSLQAELTDEVIESGLRQMPPEWYSVNGEQLAERLRQRRENLLEGVERYYRYLSERVSIRGTDRSEQVRVQRADDGSATVSFALADASEPYYEHTFIPGDTRSLRIYTHGGDDEIISTGPANRRIEVHVIGGPGDDTLDDTGSGDLRFYDSEGNNKIFEGKRTKVESRPYENPAASADNPWQEPRDYGRWWRPDPLIYWTPDLGLVLGAGLTRTSWSFRKFPYNNLNRLTAKVAFKRKSGEVGYSNKFHFRNSDWALGGDYSVSGMKSVNFYGFGNDTIDPEELEDREFFEVEDTEFRVFPKVSWDPNRRLSMYLGGELKYSDESSTGTLIDLTQPYGSGRFGQAGVILGMNWRTLGLRRMDAALARFELAQAHDAKLLPNFGMEITAEAGHFPTVLDVDEDFSTFEAEMSGHLVLTKNDRLVLAGQIGGKKIWGRFPWRESAFIGGQDNNRGFATNRFAGHSSFYGRAELRAHLFNAMIFIPGRFWIYGIADAGRVWFDDTDDDSWHPSYGGGLALELPASPLKFRLELVKNSDEGDLKFYFATGFSY